MHFLAYPYITSLTSTRDLYRLNTILVRLYNAAASPASRLRSAGSLAIIILYKLPLHFCASGEGEQGCWFGEGGCHESSVRRMGVGEIAVRVG